MSAVQSLIGKAEKQLAALQNDLVRIEDLRAKDGIDGVGSVIGEASSGLATLMLTLRNLEEGLSRETSMEKRQSGKQQLKELRAKHQSFKDQIETIKSQLKEHDRTTSRSALLSSNAPPPQLTESYLAEREATTFSYAESKMAEYINMGTSTLESLRNQRNTMKAAHRRVLDAGTKLGLGQSVMRVIGRKTKQDRYIFYAGVIVVFLVMYLCWRYIL